MKVLFINPSYKRIIPNSVRQFSRDDPPLPALYLSSFLTEKGHECDIVDLTHDVIDWEKIRTNYYGLISFTVFIGEFIRNARKLAETIKSINPSIPIVFGGVLPSIFPEEMLSTYPIDYVVRYEGEYTLFELIVYLENSTKITNILGLSYRIGHTIKHNPPRHLEKNLDSFPIPKWELFGRKCNGEQIPYYFSIISSKGCPFNCSFCYNQSVESAIRHESPRWRYRTAEHIIHEIEHIHELTGTVVFTITDDNFLANRDRALKILNHFKNQKYYIEQCVGHMNNFNDENLIDSMSGIVQTATYAIESASNHLLKMLNKNLDLAKIPKINNKLFECGITTIHNFIVGLPTETHRDLKNNVELMISLKEINPFVRAHPYLYLVIPKTPLESYIIDELGYNLPRELHDYERASFDFENGREFRPWLNEEDYILLQKYCDVFKDAFQVNNRVLSENTYAILDEDPLLKSIFSGIEQVNHPLTAYHPYVLDRVLRLEEIDLRNDLKKFSVSKAESNSNFN
jgi:radical SAM superfamily enzyme YgiQ (UPF0313 family)